MRRSLIAMLALIAVFNCCFATLPSQRCLRLLRHRRRERIRFQDPNAGATDEVADSESDRAAQRETGYCGGTQYRWIRHSSLFAFGSRRVARDVHSRQRLRRIGRTT